MRSNYKQNKNQTPQDNRSKVFISHLTPKEHEKLINLVGRKCTVSGKINGKTVEVLWDTGAQVSIVSVDFLKDNFPNCTIRDVSKLLNCDLTPTAANGGNIPYKGRVELDFQISAPSMIFVKVTDSNSTGATTPGKHNSKRSNQPASWTANHQSALEKLIMSGQPKQSLCSAY